MTPKLQLIRGLAALIDSLDSTPVVRAKPIQADEKIPLYNQNLSSLPRREVLITSPYTEDYLRDMFTLKPLDEITPRYK